jgi:hypothetical protein
LPLQQPFGQPTESQTQAPLTQCRPAPHDAPVPHLQVPPLQLSFCVVLHVPQVAPAVPHWLVVRLVMQVLPEQQPFGQLLELQTQAPPTHAWPLPHAGFVPHMHTPFVQVLAVVEVHVVQVTPLVPQLANVLVVLHAPLLQQPVGHDVPSQMQALPPQRVPAPQT